MNNRKLLSVSLTILLAVALLALVAPAVSAQEQGDGNVTVELAPADGEAQTGEVQTYDINIVDADSGIGAYEFDVSVGDTAVGEIVGYQLTADDAGNQGPFDNSSIEDNGGTLALEVGLGNASEPASATDGTAFTVATVDVNATGTFGDSTTVSTEMGPGSATAVNTTGTGSYDVLGFNDSQFSVVADPADTIDIGLEPAEVVSGPGANSTYEVVVTGATDGIGGYDNIQIEFQDPSVAQFVDFFETANNNDGQQNIFSLSEIRDGNGNQASQGPVLYLEAGLADRTFNGSQEITIATATVTATGDVNDQSSVDVLQTANDGGEPAVGDTNNDQYPIGNLTGSNFEISFDMSLDFNGQEVAADNTVTVENVDSDGEQAAVVVTYPGQNGLVIAGLSVGTYAGDDVSVEIEDFGGFSSTGNADPNGTHTAHIVPVSGLSDPGYGPGDIISAGTANAIIDNEAADVVNPDILPINTGDGFGVNVGGDLSIADDYPRNQRGAFLSASSLYGPSIFDLPDDAAVPEDERFLPIATGSHVGPTGLPIQDEVYQWFDVDSDYVNDTGPVRDGTLLNFQDSELYDPPSQVVSVGFYTEGDFEEVSNTVTLNYSEAASHGLELDPKLDVSDIFDSQENFNLNPDNVTIDRASNEVRFTFGDGEVLGDDPVVQFALTFVAADPVEGLDVPGTIDYETDHKVEQEVLQAGDDEFVTASGQENFVTFEAGATALSADAVEAGNFLNQSVSGTELLSDIDSEAAVDGEANDGSFLVRQGQIVTLEADTPGDTINVFEIGTTTNAEGEEVYTLGENVVGFDDTAPGRVANLDTSQLDADTRYFVTFGDDTDNAAVLDVRALNLNGAPETDSIGFNNQDQEFEVTVNSDDSTDNAFIETWFHFEGQDIRDVVHVERETLTGTGDRDVEINPALDLVGPGNYTVTVLHSESGVTDQFEFTIEDEPVPTLVEADDVNIQSPDLFDVGTPSLFDRGDIVPIELELIGGNVATVTFGDLEDQNIEVHATVFDPTYDTADVENDADTSVTVYLNTYQIGHGYVENASAPGLDLQANKPSWIASDDFVNRNHGFFADPADDTSALLSASDLPRSQNAYATNTTDAGIDIYGGSQGGAVLSPGDIDNGPNGEFPGLRYDLHAAGDFSPYTEIGDNREDGRDDVNALDIEQRSTDEFKFWTAPGDGSNELAVGEALGTTTDDIQSLIDAGIITELETNVDENGNVTFAESVAEDDFIIVQSQSTGLEGVMHEGVLREGLSVSEFLDRSDDHVYTDEFTNTTGKTLPRDIPGEPNNRLIDFGFDIIENFQSYQDRLADADPNEELITPERIDPDLDLEAVVAGVNSDGNLAEYYFPYRVDQDLPVQTGAETVTPSLTFDADAVLEPRGGEQQLEDTIYAGDRNVPRDVNPYLSTNSLGLNESDELGYVQRSVSVDSVHVGPAGLEVPTEESYTITGTSTMAPGTELDVSLLSRTGEGTPFAKEQLNVGIDEEGTWEVTIDFANTRDGVSIQPGTTFTTDITVAGGDRPLGGADPATGFFTDGMVLADPAIEEFVFDNQQRSNGDVVTIEAFDANRVAQITLTDEDGNELGTSAELDRGLQEQFNIVLDEPLDENTEVTATATIVKPEAGESFPDGERSATVLIEDQQEAFFGVSDLSPTNGVVEQGTTVTAEATVENLGDLEGTQSVTFSVVGTDISVSESVTLAGGDSTTVSFDLPTDDVPAGSYTHQIASEDDTVSGGLTVEAPPEAAAFEIVSLSPVETSVTQGEELVVDVSVQNTGEQEGSQDVVLEVSGLGEVGSQSLTLAGSAADSVSFTVDTTEVEAGDYTHTVSVGDASAEGSLTIMEPAPADDSADDNETDNGSSDDGSGPGFGIVVAALALLGAALLAMRRQVE